VNAGQTFRDDLKPKITTNADNIQHRYRLIRFEGNAAEELELMSGCRQLATIQLLRQQQLQLLLRPHNVANVTQGRALSRYRWRSFIVLQITACLAG